MPLQAHNLGVAFEDKWVFRGASLSIGAGEKLALVGPSGSGKSLLLKSLSMLHPVNEGHLEFEGQPIVSASVPGFRSKVMYVPQRSADVDGSVEEFLSAPFAFKIHADKSFDRGQAESHFNRLGRDSEFLAKTQRDLSGGERQIVSLVRAMILDPEILLLDEPTSAMDGPTALEAENLIASWCNENESRSTLWVTHDLTQAQRASQRIISMDELSKG